MVLLLGACGDDGGGGSGECFVPVGTFLATTTITDKNGTCNSALKSFQQVLTLDGTAQSLVDPGCSGTAQRSSAAGCEYLVQEKCSSGDSTVFNAHIDGDHLTGIQMTTSGDGQCDVVWQISAVRK